MGRKYVPVSRMSNDEKRVVQYITKQLLILCYDGVKNKYNRAFDRVMEDTFNVRNCYKRLTRGMRSETEMLQLMEEIGLENAFSLARDAQYHNGLKMMIRLNHQMVDLKKERRKAEEGGRSTKASKLAKSYKKYKKSYNAMVKAYRDIFDIKDASDGNLLTFASEWLDTNYRGDDDDFYGFYADYGITNPNRGSETIEEFLRNSKKSGRRNGVFNLFNESSDDYDFDDEYEEDEEDDDTIDQIAEILQDIQGRLNNLESKSVVGNMNRRPATTAHTNSDDANHSEVMASLYQTNQNINTLAQSIQTIADLMLDEDEENVYEDNASQTAIYRGASNTSSLPKTPPQVPQEILDAMFGTADDSNDVIDAEDELIEDVSSDTPI